MLQTSGDRWCCTVGRRFVTEDNASTSRLIQANIASQRTRWWLTEKSRGDKDKQRNPTWGRIWAKIRCVRERHAQKQPQKKGLIPENNIEPVSALLVERQTMGPPCSLICQGLVLRVSISGLLISPGGLSLSWRCLINSGGKHTNTRVLMMWRAGAHARHRSASSPLSSRQRS